VRDITAVARTALTLVGPTTRRRMLALPVIALTVSAFEVVGAGAIYVLLGLLASPDAVLGIRPVRVLAGLLPGGDLRDLRIVVAVLVLAFFVLRGALLVARAYVEQRIVAGASVEIAERLLAGYLTLPYRFHTSRNSAELVRNAYLNTGMLQGGVIRPLVLLISDVILIVALGAVVVAVDPLGALLAGVLLGTVTVLVQRGIRPRLRAWGQRAQDASSAGIEAINKRASTARAARFEETFIGPC
jgi:ABC-type bacteriocin/lantibiotic exporter with double-glycine peptidase domain